MTGLPQVKLSRPYRMRHPWIFGRLVEKPDDRIPPGTVVDVLQPDGSFLGRGFYNGRARIGIRLLTTDPKEAVDQAFFAKRLGQATQLRMRQLGLGRETNAMRLVHSEGDGLSGLVVDLYDDVLAIEYFAAGPFRARDMIHAALKEHFPHAKLYWFAEKRVQKQESFDCWDVPPPPPVVVSEHGLKFEVEIGSMHKTGFFPDQRDNRLALAALCEGKSVADLCCHTGGFAVYAKAKGQARSVVGVDLDAHSLGTARRNAELNGVEIDFEAADVYQWLKDAAQAGRIYDVVILDPAKQTRSADQVEAALDQYVAMNKLAMAVVAPGGVLLTCSCSGLISEAQFLEAVRRAALHAGRDAQIFRLSGAAPDHPFLAEVPEGRYLKAAWCRLP